MWARSEWLAGWWCEAGCVRDWFSVCVCLCKQEQPKDWGKETEKQRLVWHSGYLESPRRCVFLLCPTFAQPQTIVTLLCHALIALFVHVPVRTLSAFIEATQRFPLEATDHDHLSSTRVRCRHNQTQTPVQIRAEAVATNHELHTRQQKSGCMYAHTAAARLAFFWSPITGVCCDRSKMQTLAQKQRNVWNEELHEDSKSLKASHLVTCLRASVTKQ